MEQSDFVGYAGPPDLHDGQVLQVVTDADSVTVFVRGDTGRRFGLEFTGVAGMEAIEPEGMELYALAEMTAAPPLRRFVFANWDDEDPGRLEVLARDFRVVDGGCPKADG